MEPNEHAFELIVIAPASNGWALASPEGGVMKFSTMLAGNELQKSTVFSDRPSSFSFVFLGMCSWFLGLSVSHADL